MSSQWGISLKIPQTKKIKKIKIILFGNLKLFLPLPWFLKELIILLNCLNDNYSVVEIRWQTFFSWLPADMLNGFPLLCFFSFLDIIFCFLFSPSHFGRSAAISTALSLPTTDHNSFFFLDCLLSYIWEAKNPCIKTINCP